MKRSGKLVPRGKGGGGGVGASARLGSAEAGSPGSSSYVLGASPRPGLRLAS